MATPVRRLFLWKKLNAVNLAKLGSNCNLQPEEKRQLQKSGHGYFGTLPSLAFHFSVLLIRWTELILRFAYFYSQQKTKNVDCFAFLGFCVVAFVT